MMNPRYITVWIAVVAWTVTAGCSSDDDEAVDEPTKPQEVVEESDDDEDDYEKLAEVFGLPAPPEQYFSRHRERRVEVRTEMSLEDLRAFFEENLIDYEVVDQPHGFDLVPLRAHEPTVSARYVARPGSSVRVEYQKAASVIEEPATDGDPEAGAEAETDESTDDRPRPHDPEWMKEHRGEPVEVRTDDGELLAPGAKWGEPYEPPEGSPLDDERHEPNFGRPFGEWRGM